MLGNSILQHIATDCNTLQHRRFHISTRHGSGTLRHVLSCWVISTSSTLSTLRGPRSLTTVRCVAVCDCVLQCVAVCCSVLQCVAVCCSVLQCVAVCCSVLQCVAVCCNVSTSSTLSTLRGPCSLSTIQCVAVCYCVLLCVAVCGFVLQCVAL